MSILGTGIVLRGKMSDETANNGIKQEVVTISIRINIRHGVKQNYHGTLGKRPNRGPNVQRTFSVPIPIEDEADEQYSATTRAISLTHVPLAQPARCSYS